jgi:DNA (cytosine-5)-methyltransferase 1
MARAIAAEVMRSLDKVPARPQKIVTLGDPGFLKMEMAEAASHFNVGRTVARRDRKSGARKRKQHQIEAERLRAIEFANA